MSLRRRLLLSLAALLVLSVTGAALWLRSGLALRWAVDEAVQHSHGMLSIQAASGRLTSPISLDGVVLDTPRARIEIAHLEFAWSMPWVLLKRLSVSALKLQGLTISLKPATDNGPLRFPIELPELPHLPLDLVLEDATVHDATLIPVDGRPLRVDSLSFIGRLDNSSLVLRQLRATGPELSVQGDVSLATHGVHALDATLDWRYAAPGWAPLQGHTELEGDVDVLMLKQSLAAPYGLTLNAKLKDLLTSPAWSGGLGLQRVVLDKVQHGWPAYTGDARLYFHGDLKSTAVRGDAHLHGAPFGALDARLDSRVDGQALTFQSLELRLPAAGSSLTAQGRVGFSGSTQLKGRWQDLAWPPMAPRLHSAGGSFTLQGDSKTLHVTLDGALAPKAEIQASLDVARAAPHAWNLKATAQNLRGEAALQEDWLRPLLPRGDWQVTAHGDERAAILDQADGHWLGGTLTLAGRYDVAAARWQARARVQGADTSRLAQDWPGKLDAVLSGYGGITREAPFDLKLESLQGELRGTAVSAKGEVVLADKQLRGLKTDATLGQNTLHLDGDFAQGERLDWALAAPVLAELWPDASGVLQSHGRIDLSKRSQLADFTLQLDKFAWHGYQADSLHAEAQVNGAGVGSAAVDAANLLLPGTAISSLHAKASGSLAKHALELQAQSDRGGIEVAGSGSFTAAQWDAELSTVDIAPVDVGHWQAAAPWHLSLGPHRSALDLACLVQKDARICGSGAADAQGWQLQAALTDLPLQDLQGFLPEGLSYTGTLRATLLAGGDRHDHHLNLDADLSPGSVLDTRQGEAVTLLAYTSGQAHLRSNPRFSIGKVDWTLADGGSLDVDTRMDWGAAPKLSGHIRGDMHDFQLVPALLPQVSQASGRLDLDIALAGTPSEPQFSGTAGFSDGDVTVQRLGLHMTGLQLTLNGDGTHLDLDGRAHSGDGDVTLKAAAQQTAGVWHATGELDGSDFRVLDVPEARVDASPAVQLKLDGQELAISGTVVVPHARITPRDLSGTAKVSQDQVLVGAGGGPPQERWHLHSQLHFILGDDVYFKGFGLSGNVSGSLVVSDEPGRVTTGNGELTVQNGFYSPFTQYVGLSIQNLSIETGRLTYNGGPITDPILDIRAVRVPAHPEIVQFGTVEQKAGVQVRGTLQAPLVTLWADPPLPQAQLVSFLLFGSVGALGEGNASANGSTPGVITASTLTGTSQGTQDMTVQVGGGSMALDLSYQQNAQIINGTAASGIFVGKQLSPRLYVRYGQGSGTPFYIVQLIYKLSTKWILQAQSGSSSSADLIYTLEH